MKVDVIIAYYQPHHGKWWKYVLWGLQRNKSHIGKVYVVNDGEWPKGHHLDDGGLDIEFLSHPKDGFGLSRSLNLGLGLAQTKYALVIEGDEILAPGSIACSLEQASESRLLCCGKLYVKDDHDSLEATIHSKPVFLETDHRRMMDSRRANNGRQYTYCSGGHLLLDVAAHRKIEGFNEAFGYGLHDYEYAARWMLQFGDNSVVWNTRLGNIWHIGSGVRDEIPSQESHRLLAITLAKLYGHRYHLGCGDVHDPTMLNVDARLCQGADALVDCQALDWIPDGEAQLIFHSHFLEHFTQKEAAVHLYTCYQKLAPNGMLVIECPNVERLCEAYMDGDKVEALKGLYGAASEFEGYRRGHLWGWDTETLKLAVQSVGFEVDYIGEAKGRMDEWRDLRLEAVKPAAVGEIDSGLLEAAEEGTGP